MSTKNEPGPFNCYELAEPDEPMFVLLGRDPVASFVVRYWASLRVMTGENQPSDEQVQGAIDDSKVMEKWARKLRKGKRIAIARQLHNNEIVSVPDAIAQEMITDGFYPLPEDSQGRVMLKPPRTKRKK